MTYVQEQLGEDLALLCSTMPSNPRCASYGVAPQVTPLTPPGTSPITGLPFLTAPGAPQPFNPYAPKPGLDMTKVALIGGGALVLVMLLSSRSNPSRRRRRRRNRRR